MKNILIKLLSPLVATFVALIFTIKLSPHSFFGNLLSDAWYRFTRVWMAIFYCVFYGNGAFYYQWVRDSGGTGSPRLFKRKPKHLI